MSAANLSTPEIHLAKMSRAALIGAINFAISDMPTQPGELNPNDGQENQPKRGLSIAVVGGDREQNIAGKSTSATPMVEVSDGPGKPVQGAMVTFTAPTDGPALVFDNGLRTVTVVTDIRGRARPLSITAINAGGFALKVSASFHGEVVSASISQTNQTTDKPKRDPQPASNRARGLSRTALGIILAAGAAAGVGIALGLEHKSSSAGSSLTVTIGVGTPTVGGPH